MEDQKELSAPRLAHENSQNGTTSDDHFMREMSRDIQLLATLVATATYVAGFNSPGGVWQETGDAAVHLPGDPIMRSADYRRYLVFFYCNATAFASSLMVFVLFLVLTARRKKNNLKIIVLPLQISMLLGLLSFIGAYAAGTCRDTFTLVYYSLLVAAGFITHVVVQKVRDSSDEQDKPSRQVLMLFATFALTVTYVSGLCTPGGFWDNTEGDHRPGDAILEDHHDGRLTGFFICNTTAFVASLLTIMVLLNRKLHLRTALLCSLVALIGLVGAYTAGSCRETNTTVYVVSLAPAILAYMVLYVTVDRLVWRKVEDFHDSVSGRLRTVTQTQAMQVNDLRQEVDEVNRSRRLRQASSLVQLLATLAVTITYQAGLDPPGGVWQDNGDGHMAGDPILLTTNPRRYKVFFYCNSVAFVASLVAIILVQEELLLEHYAVETAMMLELLGLIGAYATGSCRDASTSIYVMGIAGAAVVYVVLHVSDFALDNTGNDKGEDDDKREDDVLVGKMGRRFLLFAILVANITYQAGLTPPGGFLLQDDEFGHHAGDPVLLHNYPRRYKAYFYCNSISFMVSIAQILVLVNPVLYRPAVRSHALSVCTAVSFICLMGAFAAGSTQHLKTSIYIFVLLVVVFLLVILLLLVYLVVFQGRANTADEPSDGVTIQEERDHELQKKTGTKRKHLMTLGILVASVTYQAGLDPPGGSWQRSSGGHNAGNPVMHDNRRNRYLAFLYSNSMSFVASIFLIALLLPAWLRHKRLSFRVINAMVMLDFLGLLVAYAAGSCRQWKTSVYVGILVIAVLAYVIIRVASRVMLSLFRRRLRSRQGQNSPEQEPQV